MRLGSLSSFSARFSLKSTANEPEPAPEAGRPPDQDAAPSASGSSVPPGGRSHAARLRSMFTHSQANKTPPSFVQVQRKGGSRPLHLQGSTVTAMLYLVLTGTMKLDRNDLRNLANNIETLEAELEAGRKTSECRQFFNAACADIFGECKLNERELIALGRLKIHIWGELNPVRRPGYTAPFQSNSRPAILSPFPAELLSAIQNPETRRFFDALAMLEVNGEGGSSGTENPDSGHQLASADAIASDRATASSTSSNLQPETYGTIIPNPGGGDCLFHALAGRDLSSTEIEVLRAQVARITESDAERTPSYNAQQMAAELSRTPAYAPWALEVMSGRHEIPNAIYASFQRIRGMYAGEDELIQWTRIQENRRKTVVMMDDEGTLAEFRSGARTTFNQGLVETHLRQADLVLYKTGDHWAQLALREEFRKSSNDAHPRRVHFASSRAPSRTSSQVHLAETAQSPTPVDSPSGSAAG